MSDSDIAPAPERGQAGASILLVDDNRAKRLALRAILEPLGQDVVEAASGGDALRHLLREDVAVILLDVRMPAMDGFETAEFIRSRQQSELTPIIFVTAFDQAETDIGRGYDLGAVDFVFAPVVPDILRAKVTVFVELFRVQKELRRYRNQLEDLVQERTTALTAINRELEAFGYAVSHDLRAPLLALGRLSDSLLRDSDDSLDAAAKDDLHRMHRASLGMVSLFDGLQTLFRLTGGEIRRERVDVSALANEIVEDLRAADPEREVTVDIANDLAVSGDPRLVRILLANLIGNGWKFSSKRRDACISIGKEIVDGETRIYVRDNGVGFDMIDGHKLFGAFKRLHSQSDFPGAGIGLATVQRIINRHGGRIWAEGAVNEGAVFYFVL
jgi:two-component system, sensor histidine kinase and response regulator